MATHSITNGFTAAPVGEHRPSSGGRSPQPVRSFVDVLNDDRRDAAAATNPAGPRAETSRGGAPAAVTAGSGATLRALARDALAGEKRLDAMLTAAARGRTFSPSELIAMQASVFKYSQTVELLSRGTDRLLGAVKQTLGTQV